MTRLDEFPLGPGLSILECQDAANECQHGRLPFDRGPTCGCWPGLEEGNAVNEVTIYGLRAPVLGDVEVRAWLVGPPHTWKVGDELEIPERPPRFGQPRPGCPRARVTEVHEDGIAIAADVRTIDPRDDGTRWKPGRILKDSATEGRYVEDPKAA